MKMGPVISETNAERRAAREQSEEIPPFILIIDVQCEECQDDRSAENGTRRRLSKQLLWNSQFSETAGPASIPSMGGTSMRPSDGNVRPSDGTSLYS